MTGNSTEFPTGSIYQVEVLSREGNMWCDMGEHSTLALAKGSIARLRAPLTGGQKLNGLRSLEGRRFRIRRFVLAETIYPTDADAGLVS